MSINKVYNLEERTAIFGEKIIQFCKKIRLDVITKPIISQSIRACTSIGANYMEANSASSKKDFRNKIYICKKEAQEAKHWLRMILQCTPEFKVEISELSQECQELILIFGRIIASLNNREIKK